MYTVPSGDIRPDLLLISNGRYMIKIHKPFMRLYMLKRNSAMRVRHVQKRNMACGNLDEVKLYRVDGP